VDIHNLRIDRRGIRDHVGDGKREIAGLGDRIDRVVVVVVVVRNELYRDVLSETVPSSIEGGKRDPSLGDDRW